MPIEDNHMGSAAAGGSAATTRQALAFLINPFSGGGIGREVYRHLPEILDSFGLPRDAWSAELTDPDKLEEQTDHLLSCAQKVIAVGGDGTIGFVLNRLRLHVEGGNEIGLIPLGTGNDLGRALGIYHIYDQKGLLACVQRLLKAPVQYFDLWRVNGDATLASYISVGMDAAILHDFDQARKEGRLPKGAFWNKLYYLKATCGRTTSRLGAGTLLRVYRTGIRREIPLEGALCCLVANIDSYAAGAHPFPEGRIDDKLLEVMVFRHFWQYALVVTVSRTLPKVIRTLRRFLPIYQAEKVELILPDGAHAQLDGEDLTHRVHTDKRLLIENAGQANLLDLRQAAFSLF